MDPRLGARPGVGLAAEYGRLDDLQETLLGIEPAYLGVQGMWKF